MAKQLSARENGQRQAQLKRDLLAAGEAVIMAAEDRGPLMHAHVGMMLALHGAKPIPEARSQRRVGDGGN